MSSCETTLAREKVHLAPSQLPTKPAAGNSEKAFLTCESWCLRFIQTQSCTPAFSWGCLARALTAAGGVNDSHLLAYFYLLEF